MIAELFWLEKTLKIIESYHNLVYLRTINSIIREQEDDLLENVK